MFEFIFCIKHYFGFSIFIHTFKNLNNNSFSRFNQIIKVKCIKEKIIMKNNMHPAVNLPKQLMLVL